MNVQHIMEGYRPVVNAFQKGDRVKVTYEAEYSSSNVHFHYLNADGGGVVLAPSGATIERIVPEEPSKGGTTIKFDSTGAIFTRFPDNIFTARWYQMNADPAKPMGPYGWEKVIRENGTKFKVATFA